MKKLLLSTFALCACASVAHAAVMTMTNALGGVSGAGNFTIGTAGYGQPANNWPGGEHPGLAIDGSFGPGGTKYLNFNQTNTGLIVTPDGGSAAFALDGLSFWTANDSPGRDATSYQVWFPSIRRKFESRTTAADEREIYAFRTRVRRTPLGDRLPATSLFSFAFSCSSWRSRRTCTASS